MGYTMNILGEDSYYEYTMDHLVTETIKTNEHQKIANLLEIAKIAEIPQEDYNAIMACVVAYARIQSAPKAK